MKRMWIKKHEKWDDRAHLQTSLQMISKLNRKLAFYLDKTEKLDRTLFYMKMNMNALGCFTYKMSDVDRA